jgi:hypothetical protein
VLVVVATYMYVLSNHNLPAVTLSPEEAGVVLNVMNRLLAVKLEFETTLAVIVRVLENLAVTTTLE